MANNVTSLFIEKCAACKFTPPKTTALFFLCAIFQFSRLRQLFAVIAHISYIECAGKKIGQALKTRRRTHTCVFARDRGVCVSCPGPKGVRNFYFMAADDESAVGVTKTIE